MLLIFGCKSAALAIDMASQGLAIDAAGIAIFGYLLKRDLDARDKQIARMTREEDLGSLQIELANKKTLRLSQLRQFARIVRVPPAACASIMLQSCKAMPMLGYMQIM